MLKINLRKAYLFNNTFRFIDGLCVISDHLEFDINILRIYILQSYNSKRKTFHLLKHNL